MITQDFQDKITKNKKTIKMKKIRSSLSFSRTNSTELLHLEVEKEKIRKSMLAENNGIEITESNIANNLVVIFNNKAYSLPRILQFNENPLRISEITEDDKPSIWEQFKQKLINQTAKIALMGKRGSRSVSEISSPILSSEESDKEDQEEIRSNNKTSNENQIDEFGLPLPCLLYTSPSPRDGLLSRMPSSA